MSPVTAVVPGAGDTTGDGAGATGPPADGAVVGAVATGAGVSPPPPPPQAASAKALK
ncbi:MAG TPA: hypothetical protein VGF26_02235 [Ramlibacter sp.]